MSTILIVDDQATQRRLLYHALKGDHEILEAADAGEALAKLESGDVDLALLDMHLPPHPDSAKEGIRLQRTIAERFAEVPVVIITGDTDRDLALEMVRAGVADFLLKPVDPTVLTIVVERALARGRLEHEIHRLREQIQERYAFGTLIGRSKAMRETFARLEKLTRSDTSVLLLGESGTGKSAVARALHHAGPRAEKPFVVVDPSSIAESLMESELFGHVKGAFTGADRDKPGRILTADGGTLFLDEIGNLDAGLQAKLLLFLDDRKVTPVGASNEVSVDVRLIAATNRDLQKMVQDGTFREDLLYRIQVATVVLPPMRERADDIEPLANHLLAAICKEAGRAAARLTPEALALLVDYPWPGNVRQLHHVLESSLVLADGDVLDAADVTLPATRTRSDAAEPSGSPDAFRDRVAEFERRMLVEAIEVAGGNKAAAGRALGLDENQVRYLCRKYEL